jgi:hypothetical protein
MLQIDAEAVVESVVESTPKLSKADVLDIFEDLVAYNRTMLCFYSSNDYIDFIDSNSTEERLQKARNGEKTELEVSLSDDACKEFIVGFRKNTGDKYASKSDGELMSNIAYVSQWGEIISQGMSLQDVDNEMYIDITEHRLEQNEMLARHERIWNKCFSAYEHLSLVLFSEIKPHYEHSILKDETLKYRGEVLKNLYTRACNIYLEILCLLKNSFSDGAFARSRSLYELAVISEFIFNNNENVAKAYKDSFGSDDKWYNWAKTADCFNNHKGNIRFCDLQSKSFFSIDKWRKSYGNTNQFVHGSARSTFSSLGMRGVPLAAEHSCLYLMYIVELFMSLSLDIDTLVKTIGLRKYMHMVIKMFYEKFAEIDKIESIKRS